MEKIRTVPALSLAAFVLAGVVPVLANAQQSATAATPFVFDGVTVVDVEQGKLLPDQRVVIVGNRIDAVGAVGAVTLPKDARVVDAQGKYLVPGFWDMHVHTDGQSNAFYPRFIAYGVTGIREMAQRAGEPTGDRWRARLRDVLAGARVGPRGIGPSADVSNGGGITLTSPDHARRIVDSLKAAGDVFIKLHGHPYEPAIIFALLREARRVGIPVVGHVPETVSILEVVDSGMYNLEHVVYDARPCFDFFGPQPDSTYHALSDSSDRGLEACGAVARALIRHGTWLTPTPVLGSYWLRAGNNTFFPGWLSLLYLLHRLGVTNFLSGTDINGGDNFKDAGFQAGLSTLENMEVLANAGLPALEVLQSATLNPAKYLNGTDSLGTVARGKLADLVLLDADPLADIRHVRQIRAVVANGHYFDRAALDGLLKEQP